MKSGHVQRLRLWIAGTLVCLGLCVTSVQAQAPVVCAGFDDAELLARIRGQTRDLPIRLIPAPDENVTQPTEAQLLTIARQYHADFVVSVDQEPGAARVVYVFDALTSELRVRTAPAPDRKHRFGRSAAAETVALIVRGELSDALAVREEREAAQSDGTTGPATDRLAEGASSAREQPARQRDPRPAPQRTTQQPQATRDQPSKPAKTQRVQPPPEEEAGEELPELETPEIDDTESTSSWLEDSRVSLELAGRASTVIDRRYFFAGALGLRWSVGYVSIGVTGSLSLPNSADRQGLTLTLREQSVGMEALAHLPLTAAVSGGLGAAGRFSFYRRSASSRDSSWKPQPSETNSTAAIGPIAELRWQLQQHLGLSIRIGLDVLLRPVTFRYRLDTNTSVPVELERQNRVEPWLSLGVFGSL